jgi:hypothetical protein
LFVGDDHVAIAKLDERSVFGDGDEVVHDLVGVHVQQGLSKGPPVFGDLLSQAATE